MIAITQVETPRQIAAARSLIREFTAWAEELTADTDHPPAFDDLEEQLANLPGEFAPPNGSLLLAVQDGQPAGCVGFWAVDDTTVELKRMYVRPEYRGRKIGAQLMQALIARAKAAHAQRIVLDTYHTMTDAHALYRAAGFQRVAPPPDFPPHWASRIVFMQKDLA